MSSIDEQQILQSLHESLQNVKLKCGRICVTEQSKTEIIGKGWYDIVRKPFKCDNMFKFDFFDTYSGFKEAPKMVRKTMTLVTLDSN